MRPSAAAVLRLAAVALIVAVAVSWHRPASPAPGQPAARTTCTGRAHPGAAVYTLVVEPAR